MPGDFAGHANAFTYVILVTAIVFLAGTVGRWLAQGIGQPGIVNRLLSVVRSRTDKIIEVSRAARP